MSLELITELIDRARAAGASECDAVLFKSADLSLSCRFGKPEHLERAESAGLGLRVFVGQSQASISSSDLNPEHFVTLAERAVAMAKLAPPDPYAGLAPRDLLAHSFPELDLLDPGEPTAEALLERCRQAEDAALSTQGITNSEGADAQFSTTEINLATSHGFAHGYSVSNASLSVSVLAGSGTTMERDYDYTSARHMADLDAAETVGSNAAARALARLNPSKLETASMPVVFDPRVGRSLLGTLAGAISGAAIARGTSFLKDKMGEQILPDGLSVIDDPHRVRGLGSRPFDAEGVRNAQRALIENGLLTGWLLDARSASKLGLTTTGNASRTVSGAPSPSTTNFYLAGGQYARDGLIAGIARGLYLTETFGMGVNLVTGDYSQGAAGFLIENGEITRPVSELTIAGHLAEMWRDILAADDLEFRYGINAPTLVVANMMVAGR